VLCLYSCASDSFVLDLWSCETVSSTLTEMPAKSRFTRLDAFAKTVEDARVRTTSGGVVTLVSLIAILWLVWGEWVDYRRVVVLPELIVDKSRGKYILVIRK
jgi:Endoplasmic Reticulum-Golgi Intermediate Compartment (ERGIC)